MTIYAIHGFQHKDAPHWEAAFVEAASAEEAGDILEARIGKPDDDSFDRPETVWAVTPRDTWTIEPAGSPLLFVLGGGCR